MHMFRTARLSDLPDIIRMLADDDLGSRREVVSDPIDARYLAAFAAIDSDPNQLLAVASDEADRVIGCLQLSFIPGLSRTGMWRGQIESVRVARHHRGSGQACDARARHDVDRGRSRGRRGTPGDRCL